MAYNQLNTNIKNSIATFAEKIKQVAEESKNAEQLEGLTLEEVVILIAGETGLKTSEVRDALNAHEADFDNPHQVTKTQVGLGSVENFAIATKTEAENYDSTISNKYMTPERVWQSIQVHWADKVGTAPETLDTIEELATKFQDRGELVDALEDQVNTKATKDAFNAHVDDTTNPHSVTKAQVGLGDVDNFPTASNQQTLDGTSSSLFVTPANVQAVRDALQAEIDAINTEVDDLTKADVGLGNVKNYGIATDIEALEIDPAVSTNEKYMTPRRTLDVRKAVEDDVSTSLQSLNTAFQDAIATLDAELNGDTTE